MRAPLFAHVQRYTLFAAIAAVGTGVVGCAGTAPPPDSRNQWAVLNYRPAAILDHDRLAVIATHDQEFLRRMEEQITAVTEPPLGPPKIVLTKHHLECVPFARRESNINLRGHSWHWWNAAKGQYRRASMPKIGAVMVFKRNGGSRGHLAVVKRRIGPREIIINHANWLNKGRIHLNIPVRDISRNNDWSLVRVWYTPGKRYGSSGYRVQGFIYPEILTASR